MAPICPRPALRRKTNCCLVVSPVIFSVVLASASRASFDPKREWSDSPSSLFLHFPLRPGCCASDSPLLPSTVIQIAINTVFDSEQFKCGCQCKAYKGGNETFTLAAVRSQWQQPRHVSRARQVSISG